jgi:hypothetical protein
MHGGHVADAVSTQDVLTYQRLTREDQVLLACENAPPVLELLLDAVDGLPRVDTDDDSLSAEEGLDADKHWARMLALLGRMRSVR